MKIIFVTRSFPPSVGGLQNAAFELYNGLAASNQVKLIKWGGSRYALPVIYPWLLVQTIWACWRNQGEVVYLQDGVLAITAVFVKLLSRKPVSMNLHGLDITFKFKPYRWMLAWGLKNVDQVITASDWSKAEILKHYPKMPVTIIGHGIKDEFYDAKIKRAKVPTLLTTGRLVERKGVAWFVANVLPHLVKLHPDLQYLVVGAGPMESKIRQAVTTHRLGKNVKLLGRLPSPQRNRLYNQADLFVMPNIPVDGDAEGFGVVAIEAGSCGTPVVGAKLEGVINAVRHDQTGWLLPVKDAKAFIDRIDQELKKPSLSRQKVRQAVLENNLWTDIGQQYAQAFGRLSAEI
jgi:phosphatidylinositol alpha-1,6-mannosyltransferase